ncbi:vesicular GABA transporter-like [Aplysia californica]|uniref:Vesicular GABA transporter-like n=1 Tax=Aplysia californica TaxID=6500 RepID=A0ABM1VR81_APLCA|nr:vesicular GABA transporter-like [Aplysia californica]
MWSLNAAQNDEESFGSFPLPTQDHSNFESHVLKNGTFSKSGTETIGSTTSPNGDTENGGVMSHETGWSQFQDDLVLEEAEVGGDPRDKITEWQAGWNVTNAIQVARGDKDVGALQTGKPPGYVGFLTWGFGTLEVVTNNLPSPSLKLIVNLILVCKALLSYPLPYFASVELIETALFKGKPWTCFPPCMDESRRLRWWALSLRLGLVLFTCAMAVSVPHFALLMGLIGSFTGTMLSLVWPCYFHLRLRWYSMSRLARLCDILIILLGFVCGIIGIYYSAHALSRAFRGLPPQPIHSLKLPIGQ